MRALLVVLLLSLSSCVMSDENLILVQEPPVYADNEGAVGILILEPGVQLQLYQMTQRDAAGEIHIHTNVVNPANGMIYGSGIYNPRTGHTITTQGGVMSRTIESTCTPETLYPIWFGKVYECKSSVKIGDKVFSAHLRTEFNGVTKNTQGEIVGFCGTMTETSDTVLVTSRRCFSMNGKWVMFSQSLGAVRVHKT